eukprot:5694289-Pleurochrysis_carterae.AAC.1
MEKAEDKKSIAGGTNRSRRQQLALCADTLERARAATTRTSSISAAGEACGSSESGSGRPMT